MKKKQVVLLDQGGEKLSSSCKYKKKKKKKKKKEEGLEGGARPAAHGTGLQKYGPEKSARGHSLEIKGAESARSRGHIER